MSKKRQSPIQGGDEALLVRTYAVTHPPNLGLSRRAYPDWDQLAYASRGVMTVETSQGTWVVPPHRAVWIPSAFISAFRRELGTTPGRYFAESPGHQSSAAPAQGTSAYRRTRRNAPT